MKIGTDRLETYLRIMSQTMQHTETLTDKFNTVRSYRSTKGNHADILTYCVITDVQFWLQYDLLY
jgi:hypothetical protein